MKSEANHLKQNGNDCRMTGPSSTKKIKNMLKKFEVRPLRPFVQCKQWRRYVAVGWLILCGE